MALCSIRPVTGLNRTTCIAGMNSSLQNGLDYVNYNTSINVGIEVYNTFIYLRIYDIYCNISFVSLYMYFSENVYRTELENECDYLYANKNSLI